VELLQLKTTAISELIIIITELRPMLSSP